MCVNDWAMDLTSRNVSFATLLILIIDEYTFISIHPSRGVLGHTMCYYAVYVTVLFTITTLIYQSIRTYAYRAMLYLMSQLPHQVIHTLP
jgi:hypothetical protein